MFKRLAILGSTGSIGTQTLDIVSQYPDRFKVEALCAGNNLRLLVEQAKKFNPSVVSIANEAHYPELKEALKGLPIEILAGKEATEAVSTREDIDTVVVAMVGFAGLKPTVRAVMAGKEIALANKEALVVAGELIKSAAAKSGSRILPIDSEHSAIMQCLEGEDRETVEKLIITASGGPFRTLTKEQLSTVTPAEALKHPNWSMGHKITIDSATLMNKGLEVIEARWLFDIPDDKIDVVVHPQSVIHSMVQFVDGSVKAQMGVPDMRIPIIYALSYPERLNTKIKRVSLSAIGSLTFEKPDTSRFRNLLLARHALRDGGNMPCALNAANEVAVKAFLERKTGFYGISSVVEHVLEKTEFISEASLDVYRETDTKSRLMAHDYLNKNDKR